MKKVLNLSRGAPRPSISGILMAIVILLSCSFATFEIQAKASATQVVLPGCSDVYADLYFVNPNTIKAVCASPKIAFSSFTAQSTPVAIETGTAFVAFDVQTILSDLKKQDVTSTATMGGSDVQKVDELTNSSGNITTFTAIEKEATMEVSFGRNVDVSANLMNGELLGIGKEAQEMRIPEVMLKNPSILSAAAYNQSKITESFHCFAMKNDDMKTGRVIT